MTEIADIAAAALAWLGRHENLPEDRALQFGAALSKIAIAAQTEELSAPPIPPGASLPVLCHWPAALAAIPRSGDLVARLAALAPRLRWRQNPNYLKREPLPGFLDNYAYAELVGPGDAPALARLEDCRFGLLLLGPETLYPAHHHPAEELYWPLTRSLWKLGESEWREEPPGATIHHPPGLAHATRAGARPLLALYLWVGAIAAAATVPDGG